VLFRSVHCYRMLGSFTDAEDVVQETFLRAWRSIDRFEGTAMRAWLYRIATNACLDFIKRNSRQLESARSFAEVPWLQPYPDRLLDEVAPSDEQPDAVVVAKETIELAYLAVIQLLPARQRAVLILREVLGWSANETASLLDMTVASANSALQRARATLREQLPASGTDWSPPAPSAEERTLLRRFIEAHEGTDVDAAVALLREDIRVTMPPNPWLFEGLPAMLPLLREGLSGRWRLLPTGANRLPAAASYHLDDGDSVYRAFKLDVLRIVDGAIAEITTFDASLFPQFGLPATLN